MNGVKKIFFIGPRGSGKTTIGRVVSKRLNIRFLDLDECIEKTEGLSISQLVLHRGWKYFRRVESDLLCRVCGLEDPLVVATGGGVVILRENREILKKSGVVFYIKVPVRVLIDRVKAQPSSSRPPLTDLTLEEEMKKVVLQREILYKSTAHYIVDGFKDIGDVVEDVLNCLKQF